MAHSVTCIDINLLGAMKMRGPLQNGLPEAGRRKHPAGNPAWDAAAAPWRMQPGACRCLHLRCWLAAVTATRLLLKLSNPETRWADETPQTAPVLLAGRSDSVQDLGQALPGERARKHHECPADGPHLRQQVLFELVQRVGVLQRCNKASSTHTVSSRAGHPADGPQLRQQVRFVVVQCVGVLRM